MEVPKSRLLGTRPPAFSREIRSVAQKSERFRGVGKFPVAVTADGEARQEACGRYLTTPIVSVETLDAHFGLCWRCARDMQSPKRIWRNR